MVVLAGGFVLLGGNHVGLAMTGGAVTGLALHVWVLRGRVTLRPEVFDRRLVASLRQVILLAAPLMVGVLCSHAGQLVDGVMASMLASGRLSALTYARKLTDAIVLLGSVGAGYGDVCPFSLRWPRPVGSMRCDGCS